MIDLHCHILPGFDDGAKDLGESLEMARIFRHAGYHQVVATPHLVPGTSWKPSCKKIKNQLAELNSAIKDEGLDLEVLPGMEIALDQAIPDLLDGGMAIPLAKTPYVLIEPSFQQLSLGWEQVVFNILSRGYLILLAHPERCAQLATRPELFEQLMAAGIYLQVNWASFLGFHGRAAKRMAYLLAESGRIHCLATDSHNLQAHHAPYVKAAASEIKKRIGQDNLTTIAQKNPQRVLRGASLLPMRNANSNASLKKNHKWLFLRDLKLSRKILCKRSQPLMGR